MSTTSNLARRPQGRMRGRLALALTAALVTLAAASCAGGATAGKPGNAPAGAGVSIQAPSEGDAPSFAGQTFKHGEFDLGTLSGKPVVVNFWFPSCPPCRAELPDLQAAFERFSPRGVEFVGVQQLGLDTAEDGAAFLDGLRISYPNLPDENAKIQLDYRVLSYPTTVFLDRDHNIHRKWSGLIDRDNFDEIVAEIIP